MDTINVSVLMGGPDAERDVSRQSGERVAAALEAVDGIRVVRHILEHPNEDELRTMLEAAEARVVFPVLHGPWGEGGPLQSMLRSIGIPFVGSGPEAAHRAMHKLLTKSIAARHGIPTPPARAVRTGEPIDLEPPVVVKPSDDGSSFGVHICFDASEIDAAVEAVLATHSNVMCERYIPGRELTVGVLEGEALPIFEIRPTSGVYDYASKYDRDDTEYIANPELPEGLSAQLGAWSTQLFELLGARDFSRVDWRFDGEQAWLLEVNTTPGMTSHSLLPMAASVRGIDMSALCERLVHRTLSRTHGPIDPSLHPSAPPSRQ